MKCDYDMKRNKVILVDAYHTFVIPDTGIDEDMYEILEGFEHKKILVTNADEEKQQELGIVNMPYEVFTLNFNPDKGNPEYFRMLLYQYELSPEDCIYFEHNPLAVENANKLGITSYHFDPEKRDLKALKSFLESNLL